MAWRATSARPIITSLTDCAEGVFSSAVASLLVVIVTVSMALTPIAALLSGVLIKDDAREEIEEDFEGAGSDVLMVGFSRFGQIASQILLASGWNRVRDR